MFLFTDIEGSTELLQELGDDYADAGQRRCRGRRVASIDRSSYDRPTDD
jgi:hypothetical protein